MKVLLTAIAVMALMTTAALAHDETWTWTDFSYVDVMAGSHDSVDYSADFNADFSANYSAGCSDCGSWGDWEFSSNSIDLGSEYANVIGSGSSYNSDSYSGGYSSAMGYETEYSSVI
ncbi:hypothetical protein JW859_01530 [bacterium]|nr:hypothetical protein [bacterium]